MAIPWHAGRCLAPYIDAQYQGVQQRVETELQRRFDALGLERDDRQNVIGGNFVEMLRHGQLRQCPQCKYGPVLNTYCGDLRTHDISRGQGTDRTTNECPTCGFFSASWSDWAIWDPEDFAAALRCPLCRDPCKLAAVEVPGLQERLVDVDARLSRADCAAWFSPMDFAALLFYLQMETDPDHTEWDGIFEEFKNKQMRDLTTALLQRPLLDLVRQRLFIDERAARKAMSDRAQRTASADDRLTLARRLIVDFDTPGGFDGSACAAELESVFPEGDAEVLNTIREAQEMSEGTMVSLLRRMLAQEPSNKEASNSARPDQADAPSDGDVLAAIHAIQKLLPSEKRFHSALKRQDFLLAMHIAETMKPTVEAALRRVVAGNEAMLAALRPLQWRGDGFSTLPDLGRVLQILQGHVPWPYLSSSVANYVSLGASAVPMGDRSSGSQARCARGIERSDLSKSPGHHFARHFEAKPTPEALEVPPH